MEHEFNAAWCNRQTKEKQQILAAAQNREESDAVLAFANRVMSIIKDRIALGSMMCEFHQTDKYKIAINAWLTERNFLFWWTDPYGYSMLKITWGQ